MAERRTTMTTKVKLKNGGVIEVRIEKGQIAEISYSHGTTTRAKREERAEIEFRMKNILEDDAEAFKSFLRIIESDEEFFSYGQGLLNMKRETKVKALFDCRRKFDSILAEMQKEVDKYTL